MIRHGGKAPVSRRQTTERDPIRPREGWLLIDHFDTVAGQPSSGTVSRAPYTAWRATRGIVLRLLAQPRLPALTHLSGTRLTVSIGSERLGRRVLLAKRDWERNQRIPLTACSWSRAK